MIRFIVSSEVPCEVWFENSKFVVSNSDKKLIELESYDNFQLKFKCQNNYSTDCFAEFENINGEYITNNQRVKLVQYDFQNYQIFLKQNFDAVMQKKVKKLVSNGATYNFYQNGLVEIETDSELKFSNKYNIMLTDAEVLEVKNNFKVLKLFSGIDCMVVVLNSEWFESMIFENSIVEKTENGFEILTYLNDIAQHGLVKVFETEPELRVVDEYSVYLKGKPFKDFCPQILPIYFLQCIKAQDYKEAKNCLSEKLSSGASSQHLASFFGKFEDIECTKKTESQFCCNLILSQNKRHVSKKYCFEISNNKISNIYPE